MDQTKFISFARELKTLLIKQDFVTTQIVLLGMYSFNIYLFFSFSGLSIIIILYFKILFPFFLIILLFKQFFIDFNQFC